LRALGLLDSPPEQAFDAIVDLVRRMLDVPIALISLVDSDRQWFKASCGIGAAETPRSVSFCAHAIHQPEVFVVPDATQDPRFHDNPLVTGEPNIRFYAGIPLELPSGYRIGTLCAISPIAREEFDAESQACLRIIAGLALDAIALRTVRAELAQARALLDRRSALLHSLEIPVAFVDADGRIESCNSAFSLLCSAGDPIGTTLGEALALPPGSWAASPDGGSLQRVEPGGGRPALSIYRAGEGFALVGDTERPK
jgi:GAF domain-containing protein